MRKPASKRSRRMTLISSRDRVPWNSSITEISETARSVLDPINSAALRSPRKNQIRTSVSKITETRSPQSAQVAANVVQLRPIFPNTESLVGLELCGFSLPGYRNDAGLFFAAIQERHRIAPIDGLDHF